MKRIIPFLLFLFPAIGLMSQPDVYTPAPKFPSDSATNMVPNLTISWYAVAGSTGLQYQFQMDTTLNFNSPLKVDTTQILLTGYMAHELLFGQKYFWRVRAIDQGETSYWSTIRNFIVFDEVSLYKPTDNMLDQFPLVDLTWKNKVKQGASTVTITGIRFYDYRYDSVSTFDSPALKEGSTSPNIVAAAASNLLFGHKYYYQVRARHNLDTSSWCTPWGFTVINKLTLKEPLNNAVDQMLDAQLKWDVIQGVIGYEYQLARDQNFTDLILQQSVLDTCCISSTLLQFGEKVYWRVRARQLNDTSNWADPFSFTVINDVLLESPKNTSQNVALKPVLTWTKQTAITGYELQLDSLNTFAKPILIYYPDAEDIRYTMTKQLSSLKTYYWRMRAFADGSEMADTSDWSATWSFVTVNTQGIEEPGSSSFSIYPNPANEKLTIKAMVIEAKTIHVSLIDIVGKTILTREIKLSSGSNIKEISLDNINKGVYILRINNDGQTLNQKVIVDR